MLAKNAALAKVSLPSCANGRRQHPEPAQHQHRAEHDDQRREDAPDPPVVEAEQAEAPKLEFARDDAGDQKARDHEENIDADEAARHRLRERRESSAPASPRWRGGRRHRAGIAADGKDNGGTIQDRDEQPATDAPAAPFSSRSCRDLPFSGRERLRKIRPFGGSESVLPNRPFRRRQNRPLGALKERQKTPIYSITCGWRLCARRMASFMAQIDQSAPHIAQLIRDTSKASHDRTCPADTCRH